MFKLDLEKAEEPEIKLPISIGSLKKQESSRKTSTSALLTMPKPLTVWIRINCGKFLTRWEYQTTWPASWEICMQVRKQQLERHGTADWFQIGTGVHQDCILSPCLFNSYAEYIMRNAGLEEAQAGIQIAWRTISNLRYADDTRKWRRTKEPLDESERGEWKSWLKTQHSKNEGHGIQFHHFMANRWGNGGNQCHTLYFWAPKSLQMVIKAMKLKDAYSLEGKLWPT